MAGWLRAVYVVELCCSALLAPPAISRKHDMQHFCTVPRMLQVMRLHALVIRKLPVLTPAIGGALNAAQQAAAGQPWPRSVPGHLSAQLPLLRERALSLLAAPLAGDVLAAEYLLLAALGSVSWASTPVHAVHSFGGCICFDYCYNPIAYLRYALVSQCYMLMQWGGVVPPT